VIGNPFEMVVAIVIIVTIGSIFRSRYRRSGNSRDIDMSSHTQEENARLRTELAQLKDRIAVLERITVEKENSLARQIDELKDR
jgi:hypothetical protein